MINNSVRGKNHMFRNLFGTVDGQEFDLLENGGKSCAVFVSSVLYLQKLIGDVHATVESTERDMLAFGWREIKEVREGSVVVWEKQAGHLHIGFSIGGGRAISNASNSSGVPEEHDLTYDGSRKVERIYWHSDLD
jgi:hypothetical protein